MKKTLLFFCLIAALTIAKAQSTVSLKPIVMVDSLTMPHNILTFIKPDDIQAVNVLKTKDYSGGIIYVTMKEHQVLLDLLKGTMLSLNDLKNNYVPQADRKKPILYVMDSNLLIDTAGIRIPCALPQSKGYKGRRHALF